MHTNQSFKDYLTAPSANSIFLRPVTTHELLKIISTLNESKSTGSGSVPTRLLKYIANIIAPVLCEIINACFEKGIYPNCINMPISSHFTKRIPN